MLESLFNKVASLQACNFIKKRLQYRCFPVNIAKDLWTAFYTEHFWWLLLKNMSIQYACYVRFTRGLLQLLFTFFYWKTSKWAYRLIQFLISYWETFLKPIKFMTHYYLSLLDLFLFLSTFSVFLNDYFFIWLAYQSLFSRFSVLINYIRVF